MSKYSLLSDTQKKALLSDLTAQYRAFQSRGLSLDMSRGKPGADQLDLSLDILDCINGSESCKAEDGTDCRSYGLHDGIPEAKRLFAQMLGVGPDEIIIGGNSSLNMMYDAVARAMMFGVLGSNEPWCKLEKVKFLCPVPGYDRHFKITESFGVDMINIDMTPEGPDMEQVRRYVENDESIKGIWCVPKYSNPEGITYSDAVVDAFASLRPRASDFRIFWDDAYCVHDLYQEHDHLKNILGACRAHGSEDMVFIFGSTSKISFPGSGVAMMAASKANVDFTKDQLGPQTIGPDKLNQLRHVRFFKDMNGIRAHMTKHAALLRPKFETVIGCFERELAGTGTLQWSNPRGGYFISINTLDGCAKRTVQLCREAGVKLTPAGATFPSGFDPRVRNLRIAPSCPTVAELSQAVELLSLCVRIAALEKLLGKGRVRLHSAGSFLKAACM